MFIVGWDDINIEVYKMECDKVLILLNFLSWFLRGFCYILKNELLVSMCLMNKR